jgi:carbonic anhydrase
MVLRNVALVLVVLLAGQVMAEPPHATPVAPAAEAADVTPDQALKQLAEGNIRFMGSMAEHPRTDLDRRCLTYTGGQHPVASVLSCSDSRAPVEILFDQGIGDLFSIRVAGNVADVDEIATIEYGVGHLHTPLIVVLGHTKCGAVTAVVDGAELHGNLAELTANIKPAAEAARKAHPDMHGAALVSQAIQANVWQAIADLIGRSDEIRGAVKDGKVKMVGAVYDIHSGAVLWLGEHPQQAALLAGGPLPAAKPHGDSHSDPAPAKTHDAHDSHESDSHSESHDAERGVEHADAHAPSEKSMSASHEYMILGAFLAGSATASGLVLKMLKKKKTIVMTDKDETPAT